MEAARSNQELQFYTERNSTGIDEDVRQLTKESASDLSPEQQEEVESFAHDLYSGRLGNIIRESPKSLEEIVSLSSGAFVQEFYVEYFLTDQGREDAAKMGIDVSSPENVMYGLRNIAATNANVNPEIRKRIAKTSLDWYKGQIVDALEMNKELDDAQIDHPSVKVNYKPEKLFEKLGELEAHRKFYRQIKNSLNQEEESVVRQAKILELELTMGRANAMTAELLDGMLVLGEQALKGPQSPESAAMLKRIEQLKPFLYRALTRERGQVAQDLEGIMRQELDEFHQSLARRTDYLINGVAWAQDGRLSSISPELIDFADDIIRKNEQLENATPPVFDSQTIDLLKNSRWDGSQFKQFCETVLSEWGILSQHQIGWSEAAERDGPSPDRKWQIVVSPQSDSLAVKRTKRLFIVPESFDRNLVQSLTVAAHEMTHLAQSECDTALAEHIPLAAAGGRRISDTREGGAVDQEARVYAMLGTQRPTRIGYLAALQAKLAGANRVQVARAFYDNYEDDTNLSESEKRSNRKLAADRALRLYRNGGYNTQPLNYIEGELTKRTLAQVSPELVERVMISAASFSLKDLARLHRAGLYDLPAAAKFHPADDVIRVFTDSYLESLRDS